MEYAVNMEKLAHEFYTQYATTILMDGKYDKEDIRNMAYIFYRLANENGSFRDMVQEFNTQHYVYLMQKEEAAAFMLALAKTQGFDYVDELDSENDEYEWYIES